jgi:hypothetical protein
VVSQCKLKIWFSTGTDVQYVRYRRYLMITGEARWPGGFNFQAVLRIRIHRIRMFLDLLDPDPDTLVRGADPDPSVIKQK